MFPNLRNNFLHLNSLYFCLILFEVLSAQALRDFGEYCSHTSVENISEKCDPKFICHQNRCRCKTGYGYFEQLSKCIQFDDYLCNQHKDCNGVDKNRLCNIKSNKCECNHFNGYYDSENNKLCQKRLSSLNQSCSSDNDCSLDYSYCKNSVCKCWPEFEAKKEIQRTEMKTYYYCMRKICSVNSNCQKHDNPNLICNNTICECEYGYTLDNHRVCVKISRRQNCNITCQIIGGLFASIFMLSLIYWCFYCCYSIVKNYKMHNRNRNINNNNHIIEGSPQIQSFLIRQSSIANQIHRNDQNYAINTAEERYYCFDSESPPSYSQITDEPPDYETVVHMKEND